MFMQNYQTFLFQWINYTYSNSIHFKSEIWTLYRVTKMQHKARDICGFVYDFHLKPSHIIIHFPFIDPCVQLYKYKAEE